VHVSTLPALSTSHDSCACGRYLASRHGDATRLQPIPLNSTCYMRGQGLVEVTKVAEGKKARIDGMGMKRETLFGKRQEGSWLSESDVDFFTGGKPL
jgi:hypothetical protein